MVCAAPWQTHLFVQINHSSLCDFLNILPQLFALFVNFFLNFTLRHNTTTRPVPVFP
jgi:hypothetical protein